MGNDITLYDIPALGGIASLSNVVKVNLAGILTPVNPALYNVTIANGYKILSTSGQPVLRMLEFRILKLTAPASICEIQLVNNIDDFMMSSGFSIEYPIGWASMNNDVTNSVPLKSFFQNSGSRIRISPAQNPAGNYNMPTGSFYQFGGNIIYGVG